MYDRLTSHTINHFGRGKIMKLSVHRLYWCLFLWQSITIGNSMNTPTIHQQIQECLIHEYKLDEQSTATILKKLKSLPEIVEHILVLEQFIALSKIYLSSTEPYFPEQSLPTDDAVKAAPQYHEVLAETDRIRVLYGATNNSDEEPFHRHYWKSIFINLAPSVYEIEYADGSKEIADDPIGVYELPPDTQAAAYKNIGNHSCFLRFEFKQ